MLTKTGAVSANVFAVAQTVDLLLEQALQPLLALNQWQLSCALTVQEQKIEGEEDQLIGSAFIHRRLELTEDRYAVGIESAEFAVEVSRLRLQGAKRLDCAAYRRDQSRPVRVSSLILPPSSRACMR